MKIGQFIQVNQTTRDTVRYYIEEGLLTPRKKEGNYWFSEKEQADYQAIRELRELGFSIKGIQAIQANRLVHGCGSQEQWSGNRPIVANELREIKEELAVLLDRQTRLQTLLLTLDKKINDEIT